MQEAFFSKPKLLAGGNGSPVSEDSVEGAHFTMLRSDSLIESFSQISPETKVQGMAQVESLDKYGYEKELGFNEPIA